MDDFIDNLYMDEDEVSDRSEYVEENLSQIHSEFKLMSNVNEEASILFRTIIYSILSSFKITFDKISSFFKEEHETIRLTISKECFQIETSQYGNTFFFKIRLFNLDNQINIDYNQNLIIYLNMKEFRDRLFNLNNKDCVVFYIDKNKPDKFNISMSRSFDDSSRLNEYYYIPIYSKNYNENKFNNEDYETYFKIKINNGERKSKLEAMFMIINQNDTNRFFQISKIFDGSPTIQFYIYSSANNIDKSSISILLKEPDIEFLSGKDNFQYDKLLFNFKLHYVAKFIKDIVQCKNFNKVNIYFSILTNGFLMIEYETKDKIVSSVFPNITKDDLE